MIDRWARFLRLGECQKGEGARNLDLAKGNSAGREARKLIRHMPNEIPYSSSVTLVHEKLHCSDVHCRREMARASVVEPSKRLESWGCSSTEDCQNKYCLSQDYRWACALSRSISLESPQASTSTELLDAGLPRVDAPLLPLEVSLDRG